MLQVQIHRLLLLQYCSRHGPFACIAGLTVGTFWADS